MRAGSLALWRAAPWLRDTVVLAVVDPGVGTPRRPVAIEVAGARTVLVGPDNGLLLPSAHALDRPTTAVRLRPLEPPPDVPVGVGATFDGRDLFSPVAARIAAGEWTLDDAGDPIDPGTLVGQPVPTPSPDGYGGLRCEVLWVDRFGNAQLNARPTDTARLGERVSVFIGDDPAPCRARHVRAFGELEPGELGLVVDSYGLLALAFDGSPAASRLEISEGGPVRIARTGDD